MRRRIAIFCLLVTSIGCVNAPRNSDCAWPDEPSAILDLRTAAHRRHVNADVRAAEEIAIRHADVTRGVRSGGYAGPDEYRSTRTRCFAALANDIASRHRLQLSQIADAVGQRDTRLDAAVLLVFAALFVIAANVVCRELFDRLPPDEPLPALGGAMAAAPAVSAAGVMIGGLGANIVEMIQLGDTHLSYRAFRVPWAQHWAVLFAAGIVLFGIVATIDWRRAAASSTHERDTLDKDLHPANG
jgi:hypothetical protein